MNDATGSIVWLASYPSSGNTWIRIFLENLLRAGTAPADINALVEVGHAASRASLDACLEIASSDLLPDEIEDLRPSVYEAISAERMAPYFVKIHDAMARTPSGRWLIPAEATFGVVYVLRNPLDVAVSYANHRALSLDAIIDVMADERHTLEASGRGIFTMLPQRLGSWTTHVQSWIDAPGLRVHVVRYEDLKQAPFETFSGVVRFTGLPHAPEAIRRAIAFSDFAELQRQEKSVGFTQGSLRAHTFFRRGESGAWRRDLTDAQVARLIDAHGPLMRRFGYLDAAERVRGLSIGVPAMATPAT